MSNEAPAGLSFAAPQGWLAVPPESCGLDGAVFAAVRQQNTGDPVVTNLVVGLSPVSGRQDLAAGARAYLAELSADYPVSVLASDSLTRGSMSEYNQLLQIAYPVGESTIQLKQVRILLEVADVGSPTGASLMQVLMTCPADVFPHAAQELGQFLATIAPAPLVAIPPAVATTREGSPCVQDPSVQDSSPRP